PDAFAGVPHYGMGGITSPLSDPVVLNPANPASYSFLEVTNLQTSIKGAFTQSTYQNTTSNYHNGQVNQLGMGFKKPVSKWAFAIALSPYSTVDYRFSSKDTLSDTLTAAYTYSGRGGINKATLGCSRLFRFGGTIKNADSPDSSLRSLHQLSLGVNGHYLFGNITRENAIAFSQTEHYSTVQNHNLWVRGLSLEAGLQYKVNLSTRRDPQRRVVGGSALQLGFTYALNTNLSAEYSELMYSIRFAGNTALRDTSYYLKELPGRLKIPQRIQGGAAYKLYNKGWGTFVLAAEYSVQDWSQYRLEINEDVNLDKGLNTSTGWAVGVEYKPSSDVNNHFLNRLHYRAGYRSRQSGLIINDTRIVQTAATAGLSIPIVRSQTKLHLGAEWGRRGTTSNGLVQEDFIGFMIGFS
ncbi:MAG: hypothetical protein ACKOSR_07170, partial [Flavobacteriales bacterium]